MARNSRQAHRPRLPLFQIPRISSFVVHASPVCPGDRRDFIVLAPSSRTRGALGATLVTNDERELQGVRRLTIENCTVH